MTIYFDMDGTIANFYGVDGWLDALEASDPKPYREAKPMMNFSALARKLNRVQRAGYNIGIVSWLSKSGTEEFNQLVTAVKLAWLKKHLPSVNWNEIHIVKYGTPKSTVINDNGYLFDDEERNRIEWNKNAGIAYEPADIMEVLTDLLG